jgi:hypothetical protein
MFSVIDRMLFPDFVNVVEGDNHYVYPIFKNGSTTMLKSDNARVLTFSEIRDLELIDVYIREPYERFLSGVLTYCNEYDLDPLQASKIINKVYFVDNHFCPQLFWVLNLKRFTNADIRINNLDNLPANKKLQNKQTGYDHLDKLFSNNIDLKFHLELDYVLYENHMGQVVSVNRILETLKSNYADLYNQTFGYTKTIMADLGI